ncbi:MAG TPA: M14-type cytosolic carboxypeptidase [Casimicrobiaceae bacterium]|nr:M14-type cytosolic carboxypeptidase [Casimicrobiaceae bacterium]
MPLSISSSFDAGAIEVVSLARADDIQLAIRADSHADFRQWFHFRLQGARGVPCRLRFVNAAACTYVDGWERYDIAASYDREHWFRVPASFDGREMTALCTPSYDSIHFAYFEPYSWERHLALIGRAQLSSRARITRLGASIEGRDIDLVSIGSESEDRAPVWIIARQHPGETMAEWFMEGLIDRLLDASDALAMAALERTVFHLVPNMNPDGSVHGNLRTNAAGANLNREWLSPSFDRSPEVAVVREAMLRTGVRLFLDVHGDEGLPYVFVDGCEMLPSYTPAHAARERAFTTALRAANPDFQTERGYSRDKDTKVNLSLASKWVGDRFGCLSLTLEMPFKDNANLPHPGTGWNGIRSRRLGADVLQAILAGLSVA